MNLMITSHNKLALRWHSLKKVILKHSFQPVFISNYVCFVL